MRRNRACKGLMRQSQPRNIGLSSLEDGQLVFRSRAVHSQAVARLVQVLSPPILLDLRRCPRPIHLYSGDDGCFRCNPFSPRDAPTKIVSEAITLLVHSALVERGPVQILTVGLVATPQSVCRRVRASGRPPSESKPNKRDCRQMRGTVLRYQQLPDAHN